MGKGRVKVFLVSTSVSSMAVKPGKTHPLSVLDHAMEKHRIRAVWYFAGGPGVAREGLKESLTEVLSHYPAVTGRLTRGAEDGNWVVKCNDAGLRVVDAKVGVGLQEWFRTADEEEEEDLTYWEEMGEDPYIWSPFYIQINEFTCGGIAIGITCPHMYADFTTVTLLIKAWGDVHRRASIVHPPFFHPPGLRGRSNPNTSTVSASLLSSKSLIPPSPPSLMSTITFRFSDDSIRTLFSRINSISPQASPFDALASLFWWRVASLTKSHTSHVLTLGIDFRKRMYAPLPHGFFGNAVHFSTVAMAEGEGMAEEGWWGRAAEAVRVHVEGQEEEEYWSAIDWLEGRRKAGKYGEAFQMYGPGLTCVMMDHMYVYGPQFEEGGKGPLHASYRVEGCLDGEGLVVVLPHPEEGVGRTVVATLPTDVADQLRRDDVITRLAGSLVFDSVA